MRRVWFEAGRAHKQFDAGESELFDAEVAVARAAARAGVGPRVLAATASRLTTARVGRPFAKNPETLRALAQTLARFHRLPVPPAIERAQYRWLPASIVEYAKATRARSPRATPLLAHARGLEPLVEGAPLALCHGDVKVSNLRVWRGEVTLVDFEAARVADPAWDLANAALGLTLTAPEEDLLVATWADASGESRVSALCRFHAWRLVGLVFHPLDLRARQKGRERVPLLERRSKEVLTALNRPSPA